jgi:hypothetical protein
MLATSGGDSQHVPAIDLPLDSLLGSQNLEEYTVR